MSIAYQSFGLQQGQDVQLPITVVDSSGAAVDLTGASARFAMARDESSTPVIDSAASPQTASIAITDASGGVLTVTLKDTDLDGLAGDYYYECKVTDSGGNESITTRGWITMDKALT